MFKNTAQTVIEKARYFPIRLKNWIRELLLNTVGGTCNTFVGYTYMNWIICWEWPIECIWTDAIPKTHHSRTRLRTIEVEIKKSERLSAKNMLSHKTKKGS